MYVHAYMHTCIHAYMHACMHTYINTHTHTGDLALPGVNRVWKNDVMMIYDDVT